MKRWAYAIGLAATLGFGVSNHAEAQAAPDMEILAPPPKEVGFDQNIGDSVPLDATFRDETGKDGPLRRLLHRRQAGRDVARVLHVSDALRARMQGLASALRGVTTLDAGNDFNVVTISFEPNDTPRWPRPKQKTAVTNYGRAGAASGWHFLTGDKAEIERVTAAVGFRYTWDAASQQYAHADGRRRRSRPRARSRAISSASSTRPRTSALARRGVDRASSARSSTAAAPLLPLRPQSREIRTGSLSDAMRTARGAHPACRSAHSSSS